jgi:ribosome-binding protein aMBF1 (putative translation factor)
MDEPYRRPTRAEIAARIAAKDGRDGARQAGQPAPPSGTGAAIAAIRFGGRVAAERRRRGWSTAEAAAGTGIGKMRLAAIERGVPSIPLGVAAQLAATLGISLDGLLGPCPQCGDSPPPGFTCNACGTGAEATRG